MKHSLYVISYYSFFFINYKLLTWISNQNLNTILSLRNTKLKEEIKLA